jgi:hypothetical protein
MHAYRFALASLLFALSACSAAPTSHDQSYQPAAVVGDAATGIEWRVVGNFTPLSVNRVDADWLGNSDELLAKGDISLMAAERRELSHVAAQAKSLSDSHLRNSKLPAEVARLHLHYREVIDSHAYAMAGHTRLTPLFDMKKVEQWREFRPDIPYVPAQFVPIVANVQALMPPCQWQIDGKTHQNDCQSIAFAVPAQGRNLSVTDARDQRREVRVMPRQVTVLALGDADIAGEGVGHWHDVQCHRSTLSWPFLLAERWASEQPGTQFNVISRACAGATIANLLDKDHSGVEHPLLTVGAKGVEVPARVRRPQIAAAVEDLCGHTADCSKNVHQPDYVLLSAGAADLGYYQRITAALDGDLDSIETLSAAAGKQLLSDYRRLATALRQQFPQSRVIMTGKLDPLHRTSRELCSDSSAVTTPVQRARGRVRSAIDSVTGWLQSEREGVRQLQQQWVRPVLAAMDEAGRTLEAESDGFWHYVPLSGYDGNGGQTAGDEVRGFCHRGDDVNGAWFDRVVATDTPRDIMAANVFAQLYMAARVHNKICALDKALSCHQ